MELNDLKLFVDDNRHFTSLCEEYGWDLPDEVIDYGEGWEAMGKHVSSMGFLDRQIVQECRVSGGKVIAPHPNVEPSHSYWLSPRWIARKCKCSIKDAETLADCWAILDVNKSMVDTFIDWLNRPGKFPSGLKYFEDLASEVAEAESSNPDDVLNSSFQEEAVNGEVVLKPVESEEETDSTPPVAYHVIGEYGEPPIPWLSKQPFQYRSLINRVRNADFPTLSEIGKQVYKNNGFTRAQAGVFWTEYHLRKKALMKGRG